MEQILVVPTEVFYSCGKFQGFNSPNDNYLSKLMSTENVSFKPRDKMEEDPSFKQLIPYCLLTYYNTDGVIEVFQYQRGKGQGESRLHSKKSIGIGGHISLKDKVFQDTDKVDGLSLYDRGMRRELDEEVIIGCDYTTSFAGLINDDEDAVGKVHLGLVHILRLESPNVIAREKDIKNSGFVTITELVKDIHEYEGWSQICISSLFESIVRENLSC